MIMVVAVGAVAVGVLVFQVPKFQAKLWKQDLISCESPLHIPRLYWKLP